MAPLGKVPIIFLMHRIALSSLLLATLALGAHAAPRPERLPQLMDRLAKSQSEMDTKQDMLLTYAKRNIATDRTKPWVEERLRDLVTCQRLNTELYQEYRATLQVAGPGAASLAPKVTALEDTQTRLGANHMTLTQFFGPFWESANPGNGAPAAPQNTPAPAVVAAAPAGQAVPANLLAPMPGTPPPFGGNPEPASDAGPASSTDAPAPVQLTHETPTAPAPDDGEAAYKKTLAEIQATMTSETATPDARQKAYQEFLKLKTTRRERFK